MNKNPWVGAQEYAAARESSSFPTLYDRYIPRPAPERLPPGPDEIPPWVPYQEPVDPLEAILNQEPQGENPWAHTEGPVDPLDALLGPNTEPAPEPGLSDNPWSAAQQPEPGFDAQAPAGLGPAAASGNPWG